jgi:NTP pyrophosphatase (non-canonical NTP hydrolase)
MLTEVEKTKIIHDSTRVFTIQNRMDKLIEEAGELIQALIKIKYAQENNQVKRLANLHCELADVAVCLHTVSLLCELPQEVVDSKYLKLQKKASESEQ